MKDREISPSGLEFQPGSRQASSLVEIPTPRVRFLYPTWTLMTDCYILLHEISFRLLILQTRFTLYYGKQSLSANNHPSPLPYVTRLLFVSEFIGGLAVWVNKFNNSESNQNRWRLSKRILKVYMPHFPCHEIQDCHFLFLSRTNRFLE